MRRLFLDREKINKWMKRAAIISAVIFIISLIGMLAGSTLPTQVEEEISLLSYEHSGRFDYLVYLKPSYLFGPEPREEPEPPPSAKYPTALIEDEIDMSFRYQTDLPPLQEIKQGVRIEAVLKNGDIWQKTIELVPTTEKIGSFKVEFELDLDEISEIYDTIDEETEINTSSREVTIVARLGLGEHLESESFVQSLPITLSKSVLEIGGELVKVVTDDTGGIEARGTFDYTIYLEEENSLYKTDTLKPPPATPYIPPQPKTLGVGPVIPYKLVDRMETSYYYDFRSSRPVTDLYGEVTVTATLDNPELWSKSFVLVPSTRQEGNFKVDFPVDIVYLNELLTTIRTETGTSGEAYSLVIEAFVHVTAHTDYGPIDEVFTQTLSTELGGGTLIWNEELEMTEEGAITTTHIIPNPNRYLGLSVDGVKKTSLILGLIFLAIFIASLVFYNQTKPTELPLFEKEALSIGKKYADRIAQASSQTPVASEKIISLGSIEDLVKVADELGKPIMHQPPTNSEKQHTYYVLDGTTQYQYIVAKRGKERRSHVGKSKWL
jgi:hypothetical protein